ncbi:MAG: hypothetical protein P8Z30_14925 [Acidobacteriota bacterium]
MDSYTRRGFIRRSMEGAAALGLSVAGKPSPLAAASHNLVPQGTPNPAQSGPARPAKLEVTRDVVRKQFTGVGFHTEMFLDSSTDDFFKQVTAKRWRELNPRFARMWHSWAPGKPGTRDPQALDALARQLLYMKENSNTVAYVTTSGLKDTVSKEDNLAYARAVVDDLEYLRNKGATNLKYYCCTNELSLDEWASLHNDLPRFQQYQQYIYNEITRRGLEIKLLATDASPISYWGTIEWAAQHMDDITGVYGGHHYINRHAPDDLAFYDWFKGKCEWAVGIARAKGKDFILGEFGPAQYQVLKYGIRWDTCKYFGTAREPLAGLQLAEAAIAAVNAGVYGMGYWTFMDYPDEKGRGYINHWGTFKWMTNDAVTRAPYYSYGLLTKFFRGPATVFRVNTGDEMLRAAALQHDEEGTWSIAVVNRERREVPLTISLPGSNRATAFRKYVYSAQNVPVTEDGDLQEPEGKVALHGNELTDTLKTSSLTLYTTAYDDEPPAPVKGLEVKRIHDTRLAGWPTAANLVKWTPSTATDLCYYRVYHHGVRIGSTVANEFVDAGPTVGSQSGYSVVAVDRSGNASQS